MQTTSSRSMWLSFGLPSVLVLFVSLITYFLLDQSIRRHSDRVDQIDARVKVLEVKQLGGGRADPPNGPDTTANWEKAIELQKNGKFEESKQIWTVVLQNLPKDDPKAALVDEFISKCDKEINPPTPIPEKGIADYYPVGKKVVSHAALRAQGRGENKAWGFKSECKFLYIANVRTETEVTESSPKVGVIKFRHRFLTVSQSLVVTEASIQTTLDEDMSPALSLVMTELDRQLGENPVYPKIKAGAMLINEADPRLKGTLTYLARWIGIDPEKAAFPEGTFVQTKMSKLNGVVLDFTYVSGFGISEIVQHGEPKTLSNAELVQVANSLSSTLDYHIFPVVDRKPGEKWTVRAADVGGLLALDGLDLQVDGIMEVQREASSNPSPIPLKILSGDFDLKSNERGERNSGRAQIKSGNAMFSPTDKVLEKCDLKFNMTALWQAKEESLLFQTKGVRDLKVDSAYRAERQTQDKDPGARTDLP